jgi:hypothetical protein
LNNLGNLSMAQARYPEALQAYSESARLAQLMGNPMLAGQAHANAAFATLHHGPPQAARHQLTMARWKLSSR